MVIDLPPGIGLSGTPLGTFRAPPVARRRAWLAFALVLGFGAATWAFVSRHPASYHASTQIVLPVSRKFPFNRSLWQGRSISGGPEPPT